MATLSHSDKPHLVGLLWTGDEAIAENSDDTEQPQETNFHVPGGIRTRNPSKRALADPSRRLRRLWDRHKRKKSNKFRLT